MWYVCAVSRRRPCDPVCGGELTEVQALLSVEATDGVYVSCPEYFRMLFSLRPR